jgi:5-bromo-4-chloroindolyl phosphate hydrolysis protein
VWKEKPFGRDEWQVLRNKLEESRKKITRWCQEVIGSSEKELKEKTKILEDLQGDEGLLKMEEIRGLQRDIDDLLEQ